MPGAYQHLPWVLVVLFLLIKISYGGEALPSASRISGSPYPVSAIPAVAIPISLGSFTYEQQISLLSLAGQLARASSPQLYFLVNGRAYDIWLNDLQKNYNLSLDNSFVNSNNFSAIISKFRASIAGYALFTNANQSDATAAIGVCAAANGVVAISLADQPILKALNIPLFQDVRGKDQEWVYGLYSNKFSKSVLSYQNPVALNYLTDFSVFATAFTMYESKIGAFSAAVLAGQKTNSAMFGWGPSEDQLVALGSSFGVYVHASDWAENLSFLSNIEVPQIRQKEEEEEVPVRENVHTVTFLMTDGDNVQWVLNNFATDPSWFGSPLRGKAPIGWTMSPALAELAPSVLQSIYDNCTRTESGSDTIVAAPSGLGYCYPELYKNATSFAELTAAFLKKGNMTGIVNVIGEFLDYPSLLPLLQQDEISAVFYYLYSSYAALNGSIEFVNGKPVIGARWQLWPDPFDNSTSLISKINAAPRDITSSSSYSLIPVNVWHANVTMLIDVVDGLDTEGVQVVTPKQFVYLVNQNLKGKN